MRARNPEWTSNHIGVSITDEELGNESSTVQEEAVKMRLCPASKSIFAQEHPLQAWAAQLNKFPNAAKRALEDLMPFTTTYRCEQGFLTMKAIKAAQRNSLYPQDEMRMLESTIQPDLDEILKDRREYRCPGSLKHLRDPEEENSLFNRNTQESEAQTECATHA